MRKANARHSPPWTAVAVMAGVGLTQQTSTGMLSPRATLIAAAISASAQAPQDWLRPALKWARAEHGGQGPGRQPPTPGISTARRDP